MPPVIPVQIDKKLPQLAFWDAEATKPPDRPVEPGNRKLRVETPRLASTPLLEAPNLELKTSDMKMASAPVPASAALTLPPATTMPLRMLQPGKDAAGPTSIDPFTGEPVQRDRSFRRPRSAHRCAQVIVYSGRQPDGATAWSHPVLRFPRSRRRRRTALAAHPQTRRTEATAVGTAPPAQLVPGDGRLFGILNPPGLNGTPLRIIHPNNGVFDIVVVQTSTSESFPDAAAALSGRPIYTVYLQVGATKEWVLQFCVPDKGGPVQTGGLVSLGKPGAHRRSLPHGHRATARRLAAWFGLSAGPRIPGRIGTVPRPENPARRGSPLLQPPALCWTIWAIGSSGRPSATGAR